MNIWESVKCIQLFCGRLDFVHIAVLRERKFYNGLYRANNSVVKERFRNIRYDIRFRKLCCSTALAVYLLLFSASYYLHRPTASGARYKRSACIDNDTLRLAAAACCDMG